MPIAARFLTAIEAANAANACDTALFCAALERIGCVDLNTFLSSRGSFHEGAVAPADLTTMVSDVKRAAAGAAEGAVAGDYDAFPADAAGAAVIRALVYAARRSFKLEERDELAQTDKKDADEAKDLPAQEISDVWEAGELVTGGFTFLPEKWRLSDTNMSRMIRANREGKLWIPAVELGGMAYREPASHKTLTTLLKLAGGDALQLSQGGDTAERHDVPEIPADYADIISHRSAALIAAYSTNQASTEFVKSARFKMLTPHTLVAKSSSPAVMLLPRQVAALERLLRSSARRGYSISQLIQIDREVINAILDRCQGYKHDGNLAVEHVIEGRRDLWAPPTVGDLAMLSACNGAMSDAGSSVLGPSASHVGSPVPRGGAPSDAERRLQSERDKALSELRKRQREQTGSESGGRRGAVVYGGSGKRMGGGTANANSICLQFNQATGCYRDQCKLRHVCNRQGCGSKDHCALHH